MVLKWESRLVLGVSISAWIFSHRTDIKSNGNGKSLAFCYKYPIVISCDCCSCLISIHSACFQIRVVWVWHWYRVSEHTLQTENMLCFMRALWWMPALLPELAKLSHVWCCSAPPVSDNTPGTDSDRFWKCKSLGWCHNEIMKSGRGRERLDWKCEWGILNPYQCNADRGSVYRNVSADYIQQTSGICF